jgi:hypothetical protein
MLQRSSIVGRTRRIIALSRSATAIGTLAWILFWCASAPAADPFFYWHFSELYSNADGSVQFIELECNPGLAGEIFSSGAMFHSTATGKSLTLTQNLSGSTLSKKLLLATPGFTSIPGAVPPDFPTFPLPAGFFDPEGDFITLYHHGLLDSRRILPANPVPTDGVMSRVYPSDTVETNSPTNFSGQTGSIGLSVLAGDYNDNGTIDAADYVVWRQNVNTSNSIPNDKTPQSVMQEDYTVWRANFGRSAGSALLINTAIPEPTGIFMVFAGLFLIFLHRCGLRLVAAWHFGGKHPMAGVALPRF